MKVFIVEDSPMMRARIMELCATVERAEIVGSAETAQDAIDRIHTLKPDVVVLDIRLQTGNGFDVLRAVKANRQSPVVLVLTAFNSPKYREASLNLGADYFFHKTTEFEKIAATLTTLSDAGKKNKQ